MVTQTLSIRENTVFQPVANRTENQWNQRTVQQVSPSVIDLDLSKCIGLHGETLKYCGSCFWPLPSELTKLSDEGFTSFIPYFPGLQKISVHHPITDSSLNKMAESCSQLTDLDLNSCRYLHGEGLIPVLKQNPNVRRLNLSDCQSLTDIGMKAIASCHNLRSLNLNFPYGKPAGITEAGILKVVQSCRKLEEWLSFSLPAMSDACVKALAENCPDLLIVNLRACTITNDSMQAIQTLRKLQELHLGCCKQLKGDFLIPIGKGCPDLHCLDLEGQDNVTDASLEAIAQGCPNLETLDLGRAAGFSAKGIRAIARGCQNLKNLNLGLFQELTDLDIQSLAENCPHLQKLIIPFAKYLTFASIEALANHSSKLEELILPGTKLFQSVVETRAFFQKCSQLRKLDASWSWEEVPIKVIQTIIQGAHHLQFLNLSHSPSISGSWNERQPVIRSSLKKLEISSVDLTPQNAKGIFANCPALESVDLSYSQKIDDSTILFLGVQCANLQDLNIEGCSLLTVKTIDYLLDRNIFPKLKKLTISTRSYNQFSYEDIKRLSYRFNIQY